MNPWTKLVKTNLEYQNLWTNIEEYEIETNSSPHDILSGYPPRKLSSNDDENQLEWVVPQLVDSQNSLNLNTINQWFKSINKLCNIKPKRITIALIHDDSTIVYYFIHNGVVKPNQN